MNLNKNKIKVIYIGGVGYSGSTILGTVLGNHPQALFVGELSMLPREGWLADYTCACGELIQECKFWQNVLHRWEKKTITTVDKLIKLENQFDRRLIFPKVILSTFYSQLNYSQYSHYTYSLFKSICEISGKHIIIDSSKRFSRALSLSKLNGIDLRIIHLVRDSRGVAYSWSKPKRPKQRSIWDTSLRWNLTNLAFDIIGRLVEKRKICLIKYENFIANPGEVINKLEEFLEVDFGSVSKIIQKNGEFSIDEHVGIGNGFLRNHESVTIRSNIDWQDQLPENKKQKVWCLTKWYMRKYGYEQ